MGYSGPDAKKANNAFHWAAGVDDDVLDTFRSKPPAKFNFL
jgi:hypothetical protein